MSITVAKYTFSSWLRKGIGTKINQTDNLGDGSVSIKERSTVPIDVNINSRSVHKDFALLGPGDIIGINPKMVVRTEPLNFITDFEPNYLPFIEFYDEDFLWRYTPAKANGEKLRPWIVLLILKDGETEAEREFVKNDKKMPLPTVIVKNAQALPPPHQTWAWAHGHINEGYNADSEFEEFLASLHNLNSPNADKIICRLMSPRKLEPNTPYRAFVVPAFETGRCAGLGLDTKDIDAQQPSWQSGSSNVKFPVYYEWYFRTGQNQDFESLVKLLEPRVMDSRVGIRDMDGSEPGFGMTVGTDIGNILPATSKQSIIGLEGALKAPTTKSKPESIDISRPFFTQLQSILNFPAILKKQSNLSIDPVVSPPIYGENHALTHEVDIIDNGWLHELNKDPRNRVPAGFGTSVVQKNQENYVARAWKQVQRILEANRKILYTSFAMVFAETIKTNYISKLAPEKTLLFFAPILRKVKGSPTTLHYQMQQSSIPTAAVSASFRRILRPRGAYAQKIKKSDPAFSHIQLLKDLNSGKISAAPPKKAPDNITRIDKIADQHPIIKLDGILQLLLKNRLLILIILLLIFLLVAIISSAWILCVGLSLLAISLYLISGKWEKQAEIAEAYKDPAYILDIVKNTEQRPGYTFTETDPVVPHTLGASSGTKITQEENLTSSGTDAVSYQSVSYHTSSVGGKDSMEAVNFRKAATVLNTRLSVKAPEKVYEPFDINNAFEKLMTVTDPKVAFPRMLASLVYFSFNPDWLTNPENLVPAMAYPDFEDPMYEKLRDISSELLIPNLKLIPQNTISLLVTNPEFIESYMVGLNHEFGRELLWREYPTDQRGSYFRQFWDVKGIITNDTGLSKEELTEKYKDIKPLDTWTSSSRLGTHNRQAGEENVVMVVRGDLLKKYPNTIIYAQKAHIYKRPNGTVDPSHEPVLIEVQTEQQMKDEIKFPMFKAEVTPDVKFFGFDLTIPEAKGDDTPQTESDDWGYYFVIQQIPGEPRFGMDITFEPDEDPVTPITWDDLSWDKYPTPNGYIDTTVLPTEFTPGGSGENLSQWGKNSAIMSYILYQKPVMIAVHAKEMLS